MSEVWIEDEVDTGSPAFTWNYRRAKMIDEDKYCIDVQTQISAVNSALQSVALGLLDEHLNHCVSHAAAEGGAEADAKLAEASAAIARLVRS